jgi:hypothetical protein
MGKLLISHRSTACPCFIPDLGELTGAGRIRLTRHKNTQLTISRKKLFIHPSLLLPNFNPFNLKQDNPYICFRK